MLKQKHNKAQSFTEYTIVAGMIAVVLVAMSTAFKRTVQRTLKDVTDVIGLQSDATPADSIADPHLHNSLVDTSASIFESRHEQDGAYHLQTNKTVESNSVSRTFMGIRQDE